MKSGIQNTSYRTFRAVCLLRISFDLNKTAAIHNAAQKPEIDANPEQII
jgi:hypothetical protein